MINAINDLIQHHGIASANLTIKPHNGSIAAVINLIPDEKAVPDQDMRAVLAVPIVLIGEDAIQSINAESVMEKVRQAIVGNDYFSQDAVTARIAQAKPKESAKANAPARKASAPKAQAPTPAAPASAAPQPVAMDSLFSADSL
jgi:hypothetical protein